MPKMRASICQRYLALGGEGSGRLRGFHWIRRLLCRIHAEHFCGLLFSPASPGCSRSRAASLHRTVHPRRQSPDPPPPSFVRCRRTILDGIDKRAKVCHALTFDIGRKPPPNLNFFGGFHARPLTPTFPYRALRSFAAFGLCIEKTAESSAESASQKKAAPLQRKPSAKSGKTAEPPKPQKPSAAAKERAFVPVFCRQLLTLRSSPSTSRLSFASAPKPPSMVLRLRFRPFERQCSLLRAASMRFFPRSA